MTCISKGLKTLIGLVAFSLWGMMSVPKLGVGRRGIAGSGCCISEKGWNVLSQSN